MDDLPLESIMAILAFWLVIIIGFIILICRLKMRSASHQTTSSTSSSFDREPKRIIQIYYIGNLDTINATSSSSTRDILSKVMARIEDHPPSYQEALSNGNPNDAANEEESPAVPMTLTPSSVHPPLQAVDVNERVDTNVVILVERNGEDVSV